VTRRVLRVGLALWALGAVAAAPFGRDAWLGVVAGGAIGLGNFSALARILGAASRARGRSALWLGALLGGIFLLLAALVFAALRYLDLHAAAVLAGVSIFVVAIFAASARDALRAA
jgi:hypothetical protein